MATYLGADSSIGGSLYRRQPYTYIGQTKLQSPFKLNYDTQYSQQAQSTAPSLGVASFPYSEEYTPTAGQRMDLSQAFPGFQDKWVAGRGNVSFPTAATSGQIYEDSNGTRWYNVGSGEQPDWKQLQQNMQTGAWEFVDKKQSAVFTPEQQTQIDSLTGQIANIDAQMKAVLNSIPAVGAQYSENLEINPQLERLRAQKNELQKQLDAIKKTPRTIGEAELFSPVTQMRDIMTSIGKGDLELTNEDGMLDTTDLRAQGAYGNWMADMLENSYKTGALQSDFYQTDGQGNLVRDEAGNPVYVPELQTMIDYITNGTPEDQQRWNQYRRDMAGAAMAQGQTLNSGFYQEQLAQDVAARAAQASEQISSTITKEISMQYEYITNSLANALVEMGYLTNKEQFQSEMAINYAQIQEAYREGIQELAQQVAEAEASRRGDIFSGILGGLANIVLGILL